jgi:hypothetical protein
MPESTERPWLSLNSVDDAEIWIANTNLEIKFYLEQAQGGYASAGQTDGQGICFELIHGGKLFLHTTSEGVLLLELSADADWIAPVIAACSGTPAPRGQRWILAEDSLIQLVLGLNSLIATSSVIMHHDFGLYLTPFR